MNILVCISNVPDTTTKVKFSDNNSEFDATGVQWIINPWDELALTRAVELKEDSNSPIDKVSVVNVGTIETEPTIRKCLAIGADEAFRIDVSPKDAYFTAFQISEFVKGKDYNFIVCGIESSDYNASSVGGMLAEFLDVPSISSVSEIKFDVGKVQIQRDIATGKQLINVNSQVVLIVQKGFADVPRIPNMRGIMTARKKPLEVISPLEGSHFTEFVDFELPQPKSAVRLIDPENVKELVNLLSNEAQVI